MATENPNPKNVAIVAEVRERLENSSTVIAAEYRGLNVPQQAELRAKVRSAGGELKIYKNTLVRLAAADVGVELDEHLTGPTALALVDPDGDSAAMAKALQDFADDNEAFVIKGGVMDGAALGADTVKALSKIPPRDVLLSQIAGAFAAPMVKLASLLKAPMSQMAGLIKALEEKGGAGIADEAAPAADEAAPEAAPAADEAAPAAEESATEDAPAEDAPAEEVVAADASEEAPAAPESEEAAASDESADAPEAAAEVTEDAAKADADAGTQEEE